MKTKPHYVPVPWRTEHPMSARTRVVLATVEHLERGMKFDTRPPGLLSAHGTFGHVVFRPGELPIWISTPTG